MGMPDRRDVVIHGWAGIVTSQTGTDELLTLKNGFHRRQKFASGIRLDDIAAGARAQGIFCDVARTVFAHEEDFGFGGNFSDSPGNFNSIYCWKSDVEQNQIWLQFFG